MLHKLYFTIYATTLNIILTLSFIFIPIILCYFIILYSSYIFHVKFA